MSQTEAPARQAVKNSYNDLLINYEIAIHAYDNILYSSNRRGRFNLDEIETMQNLFIENIGSQSEYTRSAYMLNETVKGDTEREQQVHFERARIDSSVSDLKSVYNDRLSQLTEALTPWAVQTLTGGSEIGSKYVRSLNDRETSIQDSRQGWMTAKQDIDRFKPTITRCASTTRNDDTHEMTRAYQGWKSTLDEVERAELSCYKAIRESCASDS